MKIFTMFMEIGFVRYIDDEIPKGVYFSDDASFALVSYHRASYLLFMTNALWGEMIVTKHQKDGFEIFVLIENQMEKTNNLVIR